MPDQLSPFTTRGAYTGLGTVVNQRLSHAADEHYRNQLVIGHHVAQLSNAVSTTFPDVISYSYGENFHILGNVQTITEDLVWSAHVNATALISGFPR